MFVANRLKYEVDFWKSWRGWDEHQQERFFWICMIVPATVWFRESVYFVILVSIYALIKECDGAHEGLQAKEEGRDE